MRTRVLTSAALGSVLEWYDFSIFGFLAPQIGAAFFGGDNSASTATLKAFCVYGGAFAMRPLGALLFGHVGDGGGGRGRALSWAILLMALPSLAIGCLPTHCAAERDDRAVVLRLIQGLSVGGQLAGAYVSVVEAAPARRGSGVAVLLRQLRRREPASRDATTLERSRPGNR
ncbi:transporter [Aureococcus anophagefferens]|nr:transporter [Aureococcus anophagefferens]